IRRRRREARVRDALDRSSAEEARRVEEGRALEEALAVVWQAFQPIVDRRTLAPVAFEALLRTSHATLSSPVTVLESAERLLRLADVGRTMRGAIAQAVGAGGGGGDVFVNLHPLDLLDEDLYAPDAPLTRFAGRVVLEVTERASLRELPDLAGRLTRLRALGFRLAVDDLGAGYSGLASLAELQPEFVKLDMGLVRGVQHDARRRRLVGAVVELCRSLGAITVAEGVETEEERAVLSELGCDLLQGYLLGRPARGFPAAMRRAAS
ncbi:MAG: EAL domain-containing protein, partial [Myxococcales bacterium]